MSVKAIETKYAGILFRSRLEARWAMYFDLLGVEWIYEMEGFDLGNGKLYLPDFFLPNLNVYCEVKPFEQCDERWEVFATDGRVLILLFGKVNVDLYKVIIHGDLVHCTIAHVDSEVANGLCFNPDNILLIHQENQKFCNEANSHRF